MLTTLLSALGLLLSISAVTSCASAQQDETPARRLPPPGPPARDIPANTGADEGARDPLAAPADVYAPAVNADITPSGLASRVLKHGTGTRKPTSRDTVVVHYTGWKTNGERFDSSVQRGQPAVFRLSEVIPGWTEGLQLMVVGDKRRFWIPAHLAYGDNPRDGAPAGMLVFDIELLGIQ